MRAFIVIILCAIGVTLMQATGPEGKDRLLVQSFADSKTTPANLFALDFEPRLLA